MKRFFVILLSAVAACPLLAQKPSLDHSVYDDWKTIKNLSVPDGGPWAIYSVSPQQGDDVLHITNVRTGKEFAIDRASQAVITGDASRAVFRISASYQQKRQAKIDKKKGDKAPKDTLGIIDLTTGNIHKIAALDNFKTSEVPGNYVFFKKSLKDNDTLYVLNIRSHKVDSIAKVEAYAVPAENEKVAYITKPGKKDSITVRGVFMFNPAAGTTESLMEGHKKSVFSNLHFSRKGDRLTFFANPDTTKDAAKMQDLYLYSSGKTARLIAHDDKALPKGWKPWEKADITFQDDYLIFGTAPVPREKDTTLVEFEQAQLDIWVWNEDYIQPKQKVNLSRELNRYYSARINYDGTGFAQLADEIIENVRIPEDYTKDYAIAYTNKPYRISTQWSYDSHNDIYKISLKDGSRRLLFRDSPLSDWKSSPDFNWIAAFNENDGNWYLFNTETEELRNLTGNLETEFYDNLDDHPAKDPSVGPVYWSEDSKFLLIGDRYDLWKFDPTGKNAPELFTEGKGRETKTTYTFLNPVKITGEPSYKRNTVRKGESAYLRTFNHTTKEYGYAVKDITRKGSHIKQLVSGPFTFDALNLTSGKNPVAVYLKGNFETGINLWTSKDLFKTEKQTSDINPQQKKYNWGTVELVSWNAADGAEAEGLLFKPEDFDPAKKYPVLIYFYERNSDNLYSPRVPAPSASTINIPYFVSNGYICFVPDIWYKDGHPGESCMNYLMPGCDMLCQYPWIDGDNMAIQGQSWGGYQVAYIITRTKRFKAAGAGAPVSNMTSAYGGIRWESGIARTGQYEEGQSRIGKNLWEGFDLYVENSPLFGVPDVTTPVLIMHNDNDGAVPWWQGIEFFNGLRRCGKQAWLLQYNGEAHNLMERRNRKDLSIRLEQFFGHFLKGEPMPKWMATGVPATLKGIDYGFEKAEETK